MRTCILKTHSAENEDLFRLTLPNHAEYADRHGYDIVSLHRTYKEIWWGIEDIVLDLMERYDRVLSIGSDVIITNPQHEIGRFATRDGLTFQQEGLGYDTINNDLMVWQGKDAVACAIARLRAMRPHYANNRCGLQAGMTLLSRNAEARATCVTVLKPRDPISLQGHPFLGHDSSWEPDDFSIHFLGLSNAQKFKLCRYFLLTGDVAWLPHRVCNLAPI